MACTVERHNNLSTISSSAGTNIKACLSAGCTHVILSARGAGGASDNKGKKRHPWTGDKAAQERKRALDAQSQSNIPTLVLSGGKRRFVQR